MTFLVIIEMESLDPRVKRLNIQNYQGDLTRKVPLDQFGTFEVFVQLKDDKAYRHEGIVHAPNKPMAFIFAKEQFSRRMSCSGLFVVETRNVFSTAFSEGNNTIYQYISNDFPEEGTLEAYEFFHLMKRGKQHDHVGSVEARNPQEALTLARPNFINEPPVYNIWVIKRQNILFNTTEDKIIWDSLPDKKFREASDYKASDKIKAFRDRTSG